MHYLSLGVAGLSPNEEDARRYQTGRHLSAFLLLLVAQQPDHGGSLIERLRGLNPPGWTVDTGRVYRLLRDLEKEGALRSSWRQTMAGQPVRVYEMTAGGRARLAGDADEIRLRRDTLDGFLRLFERTGRN